ncbi:MAG: MT-A70 family methyltransferase [Actinomycetota bacterium]
MGKYRTIVADPPWPMPETGERNAHPNDGWSRFAGKTVSLPYESMTLEAIAALPISDLADNDAHLYLWTTAKFLDESAAVAESWGFRPAQLLVWCKPPIGLGFGGAFCSTTEFIRFCRRGTLKAKTREDSTWWNWSRPYIDGHIAHSAKPEAFLDMVERVSPGPYLELFARRNRLGWDTWGNESLEMVEL